MALVQIPCSAGINEAVRGESVDPTAFVLNLENVRQPQRGVYDKRFGFGVRAFARADGTSPAAGYRYVSYDGVGCRIDGHQLDAWSTTSSVAYPRSRVPECLARRYPIVSRQAFLSPFGTRDSGDVASACENDIAYANGYYIIVYNEQVDSTHTQIMSAVVEQATKRVVFSGPVSATMTSSSSQLNVVAVGSDVVAVWDDQVTGTKVQGARLSVATPTSILAGWATPVDLATDMGGNTQVSACALTTRFAVIYTNTNLVTTRVSTKTFDPTTNSLTNLQSTTSTTANAAIGSVSIDGAETDQLLLAWTVPSLGVGVVEARNPTSITTVTGSALACINTSAAGMDRVVIGRTGTGTGTIAAKYTGTGGSNTWRDCLVRNFSVGGGAISNVGSLQSIYGFFPLSRPFSMGGRVYLEAGHEDTTSTAAILFDVTSYTTTSRPVATTAPRLQSYSPSTSLPGRHVVALSATAYAVLQVVATSSVSSALSVVEYDFAATNRWQPVIGAGCLLLSGGVPWAYDGQACAEMQFLVPPRVRVASAGAGSLTGTFTYTAIYEFIDALGNVVWSDTAPAQSFTSSTQNVTVEVRSLAATWRDGNDASPLEPRNLRRVRIKVYRTPNGGGSFYLLKTLINDLSAPSQSFTDSTVDATLITGALLYRFPGVVGTAQPRQCPPSMLAWCEYNGMIVGVGDDGITHWYSAQHVQGEGTYFSDVFQFPLEQGGATTALAALDGTLFIFKRRAIYAVAGEPPSDNGAVGGMGTPRRLACDVGCIEPRSVVVTAKGVFFQSERGLELLTRAQTVEFIGERVRLTTASYPVCTAATLDAGQSRVFFDLAQSETNNVVGGNGITLVYNLAFDLWESRDRRANYVGTNDTPAQSAALIYTGTAWRYAWMANDGRVYVEDQTTYTDPGAGWVWKVCETGHVKSGGLQGQQLVNRAMVLAKNLTPHNLGLALKYDYDASYATAQIHNDTQIGALGLPNEQIEIRPDDNAPCEAVSLKVYDSPPTGGGSIGTGRGSTWIGLLFDVDPTDKAYDLPDGAR